MTYPRRKVRSRMGAGLTAVAIAMSLVTAAQRSGQAEKSGHAVPEYGELYPRIAISENADQEVEALASDLGTMLKIPSVLRTKTNPVCCVWVEISRWTPNPGSSGYVIVNQPGGSLVSASDTAQLKLAIARIKASLRERGGRVEVPMGLMTNYPVIPAS